MNWPIHDVNAFCVDTLRIPFISRLSLVLVDRASGTLSSRQNPRKGQRPSQIKEGDQRMTKRTAAKYKIDRRMGENIWGRPKSPVNRREYGPG